MNIRTVNDKFFEVITQKVARKFLHASSILAIHGEYEAPIYEADDACIANIDKKLIFFQNKDVTLISDPEKIQNVQNKYLFLLQMTRRIVSYKIFFFLLNACVLRTDPMIG